MRNFLFLSLFFFAQAQMQAQFQAEPCFYAPAIEAMEQQFPGYREATQRTFEEAKRSTPTLLRSVFKIPVIVHIVWKNADENLPDSVVNQQIAILNQAYRRQNADAVKLRDIFKPIAADAMIEFELKEIRRVNTTKDFQPSLFSLAGADAVKQTAKGGDDAIDPEHFLNIWVCNIKPINILGTSSPLLGYAYPPAGLAHWPVNSAAATKGLDGVVILHKVFGDNKTFDVPTLGAMPIKGKTCVHEVGHYLGLRHVWGDGQAALLGGKDCKAEDGVDDTPHSGNQSQFDCDTTKNSCPDMPIDFPDMIENYMDYSSETCTNTFTKGQVAIMQGVLEGARKGLTQSPLANHEVANHTIFDISPNPATDFIYLTINDLGQNKNHTLEVFDLAGKNILTKVLDQNNYQTIDIQAIPSGFYLLKINGSTKKIYKM